MENRKGLIEKERGILKKDGIYFFDPSSFARGNLFYPRWGAEYTCARPYRVDRDELDVFDMFILFYIVKGKLGFDYRGGQFTAEEGDVVLIDCKYPNHYWAETEVRFRWLHFAGNASQAYCDALYARQKALYPGHRELGPRFFELLHGAKTRSRNDHAFSVALHAILGNLADSLNTGKLYHPAVREALEYMEKHYDELLSVEDLSDLVGLSLYHFSRLFREETGESLHRHLLNVRTLRAKTLLSETNTSIEEIAELTGFSSASHFIRAFKRDTRLTPLKFRELFR